MKAKKLRALVLCLVAICALTVFSAYATEADTECAHDPAGCEWITYSQSCTSDGKYVYVCKACNTELKTEVIPAHNFRSIYISKAPTCKEKGVEKIYCDWCNTISEREIPANTSSHTFGAWETTPSTCKDEGIKIRTCIYCDATQTEILPIDESKHVQAQGSEWVETVAANCNVPGEKKTLCGVCNKEFTREIPVHSDYDKIVSDEYDYNADKYIKGETKPATCTSGASTVYTCRLCATQFEVLGEKSDEHDFTDKKLWHYSDKNATCKHPGTITKYCRSNHSHKTEEVYAPHVFEGLETVIEEPSCANGGTDGKKTVRCLYCDEVETVAIPAEGQHFFGKWTLLSGSCATGGTASRKCGCGAETETVTFKAGTHLDYYKGKNTFVAPTCVNDGYYHTVCNWCSMEIYVFPEEYKCRGEHIPGKWEVTKASTCTESGEKQLTCDACDNVIDTKVVPQLSHACVVLKKGQEATCEETGLTDYLYCTACGIIFDQDTLAALGHDFVEQFAPDEGSVKICDRCYKYEIIGDSGQTVACNCLCHNSNGVAKMVWKIVIFFCKILGMNQECKCGIVHF